MDFEQIHDVIAFRVIVDSVAECYEALGVIHSLWKPGAGPLQGLHRHPEAEHVPVAAHDGDRPARRAHRGADPHARDAPHRRGGHRRALGLQGEGGTAAPSSPRRTRRSFGWLRQLMEWQRDLKDPREFLETVKVDLFSDEVFVFTPKGAVKACPAARRRSTSRTDPLRGRRALRRREGERQARPAALQAEERRHGRDPHLAERAPVEGLARLRQDEPRPGPHPAVHPPGGAARLAEIGRDIAEREFRRFGVTLNKLQKSGELEKAAQALGYRIGDDLLAAIGYGKVVPGRCSSSVLPADKLAEPAPAEPAPTSRLTEIFRKVARRPTGGVRINGIDDVLVRYGRCCNPVPGDSIVGFITRGRGVTVHTRACDKVIGDRSERRVDVAWDVKATSSARSRSASSRATGRDPREDLADLQRGGAQHLAGELPDDAGRAGGERLRGHHRRPEAAQLGHPHARADRGRPVRRAGLTVEGASSRGVACRGTRVGTAPPGPLRYGG